MSSVILNQAILTIAIFVVAVLGINVLYPCKIIEKIKIFKEEKTRKAVAYTLFVLSGILCINFICDIFVFHRVTWGYAIIKLVLLIAAIAIFCFTQYYFFGDFSFSGGYTLAAYVIIIVAAAACFYGMEGYDYERLQVEAYEDKIIAVKEPKVSKEDFKLICINDVIDLDSSYNITLSEDDTFYVVLETEPKITKESQKDYEVYSIYYESKDKSNKFEPLTINKDSTELYFIKKGEVPHITVVTSTYYYLDTNVEPSKECNHIKVLTYELHIPKSSILNAEKKETKQNS